MRNITICLVIIVFPPSIYSYQSLRGLFLISYCKLVFTFYPCTGRITSETESLFTYNPGQSAETYNNTVFVPVFDPLELPFYNLSESAQICGGNQECLFDIGSTGSTNFGNITLFTQIDFNETLDLSQPSELYGKISFHCCHQILLSSYL